MSTQTYTKVPLKGTNQPPTILPIALFVERCLACRGTVHMYNAHHRLTRSQRSSEATAEEVTGSRSVRGRYISIEIPAAPVNHTLPFSSGASHLCHQGPENSMDVFGQGAQAKLFVSYRATRTPGVPCRLRYRISTGDAEHAPTFPPNISD